MNYNILEIYLDAFTKISFDMTVVAKQTRGWKLTYLKKKKHDFG